MCLKRWTVIQFRLRCTQAATTSFALPPVVAASEPLKFNGFLLLCTKCPFIMVMGFFFVPKWMLIIGSGPFNKFKETTFFVLLAALVLFMMGNVLVCRLLIMKLCS